MKILQFVQLNSRQKNDAITKIVNIARELDLSLFGVKGEYPIREALLRDANPDAEFMFDEIDEDRVDVIYRENI